MTGGCLFSLRQSFGLDVLLFSLQSVLQKYVKNLFNAFMNSTGSHVSCVVKDLFDFFDRKATEQMAPELSNKWKSNV